MEPLTVCGLCNELFGERPRTELLCHHFFHTECVLANLVNAHPEQFDLLHCAVCQENVFPQQEEQEEEEEDAASVVSNHSNNSQQNESTRICNLYDTNEQFRDAIKKYHKAKRETSKPLKAFMKVVAAKKEELKNPYALIKAQVEGLYNTKKYDIMNSTEYKDYKKAEARSMRYYDILRQRYLIRTYHIYALRSKPGLRRLDRPFVWRNRPARIIRRALRLRLPWY